jgi:2-phospho-L-lactate guanylyltransferase
LLASDVQDLLAAARPAPACVLVASRDGAGTNALLRTPPGLFRSHFGPNSLGKHLAEAAAKNAQAFVLHNARIELDVDDENDLRVLAARADVRGATRAWLQRAGILTASSAATAD